MTTEENAQSVVSEAIDKEFAEDMIQQGISFAEEEMALVESDPELDTGEVSEEESVEGVLQSNSSGYLNKSRQELVDILAELLESRAVQSLRGDMEAIKVAFYKTRRAEIEALRREFIEAGGNIEEFVAPVDETEKRLKELFALYRAKRDTFLSQIEQDKHKNYLAKLAVIEELKQLLSSSETINNAFSEFRDLQHRWREIGPVPTVHVKDLWETYNLHVENFYNLIKIDKELRDLDLKKNYEAKLSLCEQAEALFVEESAIDAFRKLQKLHDQWRETGPVGAEFKEQLWERFRDASTKINKRHQEYFEGVKEEQQANLHLKEELCRKTEALCTRPLTTRKEWVKASEQLIEIQKVWKTIGFAPKKDNTRVYESFRAACDKFFELKRQFYLGVKSEMEHNLSLKNEICAQAEALQESDDWKKTTDELIALQKRWKEITGPVPRRYSDQVWKRFRAACDKFFERKSAHFSDVEQEHTANLEKKQALIAEMKEFVASSSEITFDVVKAFQRRWSEIGFVPIKHKESINTEYRKQIDSLFAALRSNKQGGDMERFRNRVASMSSEGNRGVQHEREKLYNRYRQLESDVAVLENNIGFFSQSKGAEAMIIDVKNKIEKLREQMAVIAEKIEIIDGQ